MMIRDSFAKRRRWTTILCIIGLLMMALGFFLTVMDTRFVLVLIGGFVLFPFGMIYGWVALRCPQCRGLWRSLAGRGFQPSLDEKIRFCPYCGYRIEMEMSSAVTKADRQTTDERITRKPANFSESERRF